MPLTGSGSRISWEITCSRLPAFREVVECSVEDAGHLVVRLQDEYRADLLRFAP
jgi:hypothetical protein